MTRSTFPHFWPFFLLIGIIGLYGTHLKAIPLTKETKKHENYTERIPDSKITFDVIAIPGGTFTMGSPETEKDRSINEDPQHSVEIRPFWMGKCEVTWDEYDLFRLSAEKDEKILRELKSPETDAVTRPTQSYIDETRDFGREGYPAIGMSHHAAMEYCRWVSWKTGKRYRLPTEAEWEYACRAGSSKTYFFGDDPKSLDDYAWYKKTSPTEDHIKGATHPVGKKKPNPWGLYDMYGNVSEWCLDHYLPQFYRECSVNKVTLNPVNLPTARRYSHIVRGGCWADNPERCRSATRRGSDKSWNRADPEEPPSIWWLANADFVGFRVVRAVEEDDNLKDIRSKVVKTSE
jgi:formylglycine-generating enzyme required for sulfatase activity